MANRTQKVLHDCDANSDDFVTNLLMRRAQCLDLIGTVISNGLCYVEDGYNTLRSIERYVGLPEVEIGTWAEEMPNPFPSAWREETRRFNQLPFLASALGVVQPPENAVDLMARKLEHAGRPVTLVCTGPMTVLAHVLRRHPSLSGKVRQVVIMGGAVRVPGNVKTEQGVTGVDGTAEWNVFCDPYAFKSVLAHDVPIRLISLDVTNKLPLSKRLLSTLADQGKTAPASHVAAELWKIQADRQIYLWDPTTAMSLIRPDLFTFKYVHVDVVTSGDSLGRVVQTAPGDGRLVELATGVDKRQVLEEVLKLLA